MQDIVSLKGTVEKIIFRNDQNGYAVLSVSVDGGEVTFVGEFPFISVGETVEAVGFWTQHSRFGTQFEVKSYQTYLPSESNDIIKYLSSGIVRGLGQVTAEKIVKEFGADTLEIINNCPEKIYQVSGVAKSKIKKVIEEFNEIFGVKVLSQELKKYGINAEETIKIWKNIGKNAISIINENPYILCSDTIDINFEKVDILAEKLGKSSDDKLRISSGIAYVLKHNLGNGHTCLPKNKLIPTVSKFLSVTQDSVEICIDEMVKNQDIMEYKINSNLFLFLPYVYKSELYCAERIIMMLKNFKLSDNDYVMSKIASQEKDNNIKYAPLQKEAIRKSVSNNVFILTGGPGTGKTTTLKAIINLLESMGEKVLLCAPTGRATQRMSTLTDRETKTIHRMLEVGWQDDKPVFHRNERNLLDCDAIIIDEFSMVDTLLFEGLLRALPLNSRLIIVGDTNQLPSVGPGNLLSDMISSGLIPMVQLNEIFRQSKESLIVTNAHKIVNGIMPELNKKDNDFFFIKNYDKAKICSTIIDLYIKRLPCRYNYSPLEDIQVICPSRVGELGTKILNQKLQELINPDNKTKNSLIINSRTFRENDKVMQNKNNYDIYWQKSDGTSGQGVFNGDIGIILEIDKSQSYVVVKFDDRVAVYNFDDVVDLELAYAITVHKSQGSEFKAVIVPVYGNSCVLNYRNILYTAVTRAQELLILVGTENTVKLMVNNNIRIKRYSGFGEMAGNIK